jgi:hypothetical protein
MTVIIVEVLSCYVVAEVLSMCHLNIFIMLYYYDNGLVCSFNLEQSISSFRDLKVENTE